MKLTDLTPLPDNPRKITDAAIEKLKQSIQRDGKFMVARPIIVSSDGVILGGNQRHRACLELGMDDIPDEWVRRVDWTEEEARRFVVVDNAPAGMAGEFDIELLSGQYALEALIDMGFDAAEFGKEPGGGGNTDPDEIPEVVTPVSKRGDIWVLDGRHRIMCGDSTSAEDVGRLMGGVQADLCFTSPPYAQQRDYNSKIEDWDLLMQGVFGNLPMSEKGQVLVNLGLIHREGEWVPYWEGWIEWMRAQGWRRFGWYVWDQGSGLPGDWNGRLAPSHEFVWHFNRQMVRPVHCIPKNPKSIRDRTGDASMRMGAETTQKATSGKASLNMHKIPDSVIRVQRQCGRIESGDYHPAVFPVELPLFIINAWPGVVYDPFGGSGTTMVACQDIGRECRMMEISPNYCDIVLERMKKFGIEPVLIKK